MDKKADFRGLTFVLSSIIIFVMFASFFLGMKTFGLTEVQSTITSADSIQKTPALLAILRVNSDNIINENYAKLKSSLESQYGKEVKCRLLVNNQEKDIGCKEIDKKPDEITLNLPRYDVSIVNVKLEVQS